MISDQFIQLKHACIINDACEACELRYMCRTDKNLAESLYTAKEAVLKQVEELQDSVKTQLKFATQFASKYHEIFGTLLDLCNLHQVKGITFEDSKIEIKTNCPPDRSACNTGFQVYIDTELVFQVGVNKSYSTWEINNQTVTVLKRYREWLAPITRLATSVGANRINKIWVAAKLRLQDLEDTVAQIEVDESILNG